MVLENPEGLPPADLRALRRRYVEERRLEELRQLADWRNRRGLKLPPITCAVCNKRTYLGPLCFEHMEQGRAMLRMWVDYTDPDRRDLHKLEDFLAIRYETNHPSFRGLPLSVKRVIEKDTQILELMFPKDSYLKHVYLVTVVAFGRQHGNEYAVVVAGPSRVRVSFQKDVRQTQIILAVPTPPVLNTAQTGNVTFHTLAQLYTREERGWTPPS